MSNLFLVSQAFLTGFFVSTIYDFTDPMAYILLMLNSFLVVGYKFSK